MVLGQRPYSHKLLKYSEQKNASREGEIGCLRLVAWMYWLGYYIHEEQEIH